jgi:hypothetical protein
MDSKVIVTDTSQIRMIMMRNLEIQQNLEKENFSLRICIENYDKDKNNQYEILQNSLIEKIRGLKLELKLLKEDYESEKYIQISNLCHLNQSLSQITQLIKDYDMIKKSFADLQSISQKQSLTTKKEIIQLQNECDNLRKQNELLSNQLLKSQLSASKTDEDYSKLKMEIEKYQSENLVATTKLEVKLLNSNILYIIIVCIL